MMARKKKEPRVRILLNKHASENPFFREIHLSKEMRELHKRIRKEMIKYNIQGMIPGIQLHMFPENEKPDGFF